MPTRQNRGAVAAWCFYDWANSAFTTLVVTFVYAFYFTETFAPNPDIGTAWWSRGVALTAVTVALLSPILGTIADRGGSRRRWLAASTAICIGFTVALTFVSPSMNNAAVMALTLFVIANVAFEVGMVFYNAYLPDLVPQARIGTVSGYGWALGYLGGLLALAAGLVLLVGLPAYGIEAVIPLPREEGFHVRATNLLVAGWFLLFSLPALLLLKDPPATGTGRLDIAGAFRQLRQTLGHIRRFKQIVVFLAARLIYNDGLVTIFAFGGVYAGGTFGMSTGEIMLFGIALNVAAGLGAWLFGFVDDKVGGKRTILVTIVALAASSLLAVMAPSKMWLWVAGIGIGIFVGPNQSASRSLMGRFVPERHKAEFFGFFAFSGKATAFLGPALLGLLSGAFGQRAGVAVVIPFFLIGGLVLLLVDEQAGIAAAGQDLPEPQA